MIAILFSTTAQQSWEYSEPGTMSESADGDAMDGYIRSHCTARQHEDEEGWLTSESCSTNNHHRSADEAVPGPSRNRQAGSRIEIVRR